MPTNPHCPARREAIKKLLLTGFSGSADVLNELEKTTILKGLVGVNDETGKIDPVEDEEVARENWIQRRKSIQKDIQEVKKELFAPVVVTDNERGIALGIYRNQQSNVLQKALAKGDLTNALKAIDKLAISYGIDTDNPVTVNLKQEVTIDATEFEKAIAAMIVEKFPDSEDIDDLFANLEGSRVASSNSSN